MSRGNPQGSLSNRMKLRKLLPYLRAINALQEPMAALSDAELQDQTRIFRERLMHGASEEEILVEAFAVAREAAKRVLGMFPFDVQVLGGLVLYQGRIAEMRTGEGKTLTATLPLYLVGLTGKGAMLVTANAYLANRDGEEMGRLYDFLGLTHSVAVRQNPLEKAYTPEQKRELYRADVVYTTYDGLGFDYLMDNLAGSLENKFLPDFHFVIIDEVDSVLLDSAQMPLIISGAPRVQSNYYSLCDRFVERLKEGEDYEINWDTRQVWFLEEGIQKAEAYFRVPNLFAPSYEELTRHLNLALRARTVFRCNKEYVVHEGEVVLLNRSSGRMLPGNKLQAGQHQAIEEKEGVKITKETRAMASVTYQSLFLKFSRLSGMSGTVAVAASEFQKTYGMDVVVIPTNRPDIRKDAPDQFYLKLEDKIDAAIDALLEAHAVGRPVLLISESVNMSNIFSELLLAEGVAHNVLNAFNAPKEAQIIAEAGQKGAVTIATPMAGRGTDIKLGPGVAKLGGILVIGTERMKSKRIDLQLRGRSGRQGDPGESRFFISLEDDLVLRWARGWEKEKNGKHRKISSRRMRRLINKAQQASDSHAEQGRKQAFEMDTILGFQRNRIYAERNALLEGKNIGEDELLPKIRAILLRNLKEKKPWTRESLQQFVEERLSYQPYSVPETLNLRKRRAMLEWLMTIFETEMEKTRQQAGSAEVYSAFVRMAFLKSIDEAWIEQIDYLNQYKQLVTSRSFAKRDPQVEYQKEALRSYRKMKRTIQENLLSYLSLGEITYNESGEPVMLFS